MRRIKKSFMFYIGIIVFSVIVLCMILTPTRSSSAKIEGEKHVKTIIVQNGDSLWSIANANYTELDGSLGDYMDEIKETNQMSSSAIRAGSYLIVPYYKIAH